MIAIVISTARERSAIATLCSANQWPAAECDSVRSFLRMLRRTAAKVVVTRQTLVDGYSDDVLAALSAKDGGLMARTLVLLPANATADAEARQITLGADCVLRDPVRSAVLTAYLEKYYTHVGLRPTTADRAPVVEFAGLVLKPLERVLSNARESVTLSPREAALAELLATSDGRPMSYDALYSEVLGRKFAGETSNMRVLLGKLSASVAKLGINLRHWIEVIPKAGYRYRRLPLNTHLSRGPDL